MKSVGRTEASWAFQTLMLIEPSARFKNLEGQVRCCNAEALQYRPEPSHHTKVCRILNDTQINMLPGYPESAICVQRFDDSLNSAIHITYRNWLRSSSMHEPRDPPLKVVFDFYLSISSIKNFTKLLTEMWFEKCTVEKSTAEKSSEAAVF